MPELEDRLRALRDHVEWPATPDLWAHVEERIATATVAAPPPRRRRPARRRRIALVVALVLLVPAAGAVAFPSARDDVLEWLGLQGAEVRRAPALPPASAPRPNDLGRVVTLEQAERQAGFRPALPASLGPPRELRYDPATGFVSAVYAEGVLVAQARGALSRELLEKVVAPGTGIRAVDVDGAPAVYIDGPHTYLYVLPDGNVAEDHPRRTPRALVVSRGDLLVRIEGLPLEEAREVAGSLR